MMLKKLRVKFVIVIMSIVTILFGTIFCGVIHFTRQNIERESIQMMRDVAFGPDRSPVPIKPPKDEMNKNVRMPFFSIERDNDGNIRTFGGDFYDLSDDEFVEELLDKVFSDDRETGIISEYDLRFLKKTAPYGTSVTFADVSNEKIMLSGFVKNSVIIGFIGYLAFFAVSISLAKWVTKPVEAAWNEQKQFVADASHELKTPLTVIMTNAEMLTDDEYSTEEKKGFTKNILSMSKRMRGLVESLLELARMDSGVSRKINEELNFSKLVSSCILTFEPLYYEKNIGLEQETEENITAQGDKGRLRQVIDILLDNALKYSYPESSVRVSLKHTGGHTLLSVSSTGKELSKEECRNIFKRFYRADEARSDGNSSGLGLAIAESIVKEHSGKIWAESEAGRNTFYVQL